MDKKELLVVLILAFIVGMAATFRFFGAPLTTPADRPKPAPVRRPPPTPGKGDPELGSITPLWPRPTERMLPGDPAARRLFDAAEAIAAEGLLEPAIAAYGRFVERFPNDPAAEIALLRIAQCCTLLRRHKEAGEQYEHFLTRYPDSVFRPMALLWSADALGHLGQTAIARKRLSQVISQYPDSPFVAGAKSLLATLDAAPPKAEAP